MTLIKCPSCEHTISSVASKCPRCGYQLMQLRFQQGNEGSLTECRKCGRKVLSKSRVCPYCGLNAPGRRPRVAALIAIGAIASTMAVLAVQGRIGSSQPSVAQPESTSVLPESQPTPSRSRPPEPVAAPVAPPESPAAIAAVPDTVAVAPPAESLPAPDSAPDLVPAVPTQTRWASDWANIREARSLEAPVLGVVRRGEPVQVANQVEGWWEVYRGGRFIGYVAGDLLLAEPPVIP